MKGAPQVTVVIPTRDRWPLLSAHALTSAMAQKDVVLEVIVVDDGSVDETPARLAALDDARVHVLRHEQPRGPSAARNAAIAQARGGWVAFLDDDDVWAPHKLRAQLDAASASGAGWVYARSVVVNDDDLRPLELEALPEPDVLTHLLGRGNVIPIGCSNVVAETALVRSVGGFDESLRSFEDWDLWIRLARASTAAACDEVLVGRVDHRARRPRRARVVMEEHATMLGKHRSVTRGDRRAVLEWLAEQNHRSGRPLAASALYLRVGIAHASPGNLVAAAGALLGRRGLDLASRVLLATRGRSHLGGRDGLAPVAPPWLAAYRASGR